MAFTHKSRTGKIYFLHSGPKRGGGTQHFFSIKSTGNLVDQLPEGFEAYETVGGQVYLRRQQPKLIQDEERDYVAAQLRKPKPSHSYKIEVSGKNLVIHESVNKITSEILPFSRMRPEEVNERFAQYQAVLRFVLVDPKRRLFAPERFCFRGSIDDWIPIGPPDSIKRLAAKYLKHLGRDSMYELF